MDLLTGLISNTSQSVLFTAENYRFCFLTDSINRCDDIIQPVTVLNHDGFIFGRTHENHSIAVYTGDNDLNIYGKQILNTGAYIVSNGNISFGELPDVFSEISFTGGTLNRVFSINGLKLDKLLEDDSGFRINDDSISFDVNTNNLNIHVIIGSKIHISDGQDGKAITNSGVTLTLSFDCSQPLSSIFKHYHTVKKILSFLTFRKNVGFEEINLTFNSDKGAKVYVNDNTELVQKYYQQNISFEDVGDSLPELFRVFFDSSLKSKTPLISFVPEDEQDVCCMTNTKLRMICSSLEKELEYVSDINVKENEQLNELKAIVKNVINDYKTDHTDFPDGAYSLAISSVRNWSLSLKERLCALCKKYIGEIALMNDSNAIIDDEDIGAFVKYRNSITHGGTEMLSEDVAKTAFVLSGVVYCCILERIGLSKSKIEELAQYKLLR